MLEKVAILRFLGISLTWFGESQFLEIRYDETSCHSQREYAWPQLLESRNLFSCARTKKLSDFEYKVVRDSQRLRHCGPSIWYVYEYRQGTCVLVGTENALGLQG